MSGTVHTKIKELISKGAVGTLCVANCTLKYTNFVPKCSLDKKESIEKMSNILYDLLMKAPHPTLNPVMEVFIKEKSGDLKETVFSYVEKYSNSTTEDCDHLNDVMTVRLDVPLLMINVLPFLEQENLIIEKASVQTPVFRYDLE